MNGWNANNDLCAQTHARNGERDPFVKRGIRLQFFNFKTFVGLFCNLLH